MLHANSHAYLSLAHAHKIISSQLLVRHGVVSIRIEHDEGKGQQVGGICCGEGVWVVSEVALRKLLHHAVDLLSFACVDAYDLQFAEKYASHCHIALCSNCWQVHGAERLSLAE